MGQINLFTEDKKIKKLHLFTMVLSFSRYKFAVWQDKPFTSSDIIQCHHKAFEYFGGVPKTIVYDQDKTMFVKENFGDIIKTDLFQKYLNTMNFKVHLCRAYDPESKGKIEAVVKFVKNNFAKHRIFTNIDDFNDLCLEWLKRTGNAKEHSAIKKVPEEMFHLEKEHLQQVPPFLFAKEEPNDNIVPYSLSKDNTVTYKSNRYQLPKETYSDKQKEVGVVCEDNQITFFNLKTKDSINTYEISKDKDKLISNISRNITPDPKVLELKSKILNHYSHKNLIIQYIENIEILKKRYIKSQFKRIDSLSNEYDQEFFLNAIKECIVKENFDLDFLVKLLSNTKKTTEAEASLQNIPEKLKNIVTETRELSEYEEKLVKLC
ncbi:MAG: DDE-type integrase/transposase/recombinase [Cetobacterium sp.]